MEIIRTWILSVTVAALVIAVAEALMPEGNVKNVGKLTGGLILILGILQPLVTMDYEDLYDIVNTIPAGASYRSELELQANAPLKRIIEAELASYIVDKGAELGADCRAEVTCQTGEGGVPIPTRVTVTGNLAPGQKEALSRYVGEELGIDREYQIYRSEGTP